MGRFAALVGARRRWQQACGTEEVLRGLVFVGGRYKSKVLDATFPRAEGVEALGKHIVRLCEEASKAVTDGYAFLILSDRAIR